MVNLEGYGKYRLGLTTAEINKLIKDIAPELNFNQALEIFRGAHPCKSFYVEDDNVLIPRYIVRLRLYKLLDYLSKR